MMYGPNQWPEQPAALRYVMIAYHREIHALAYQLQRAFALGIGCEEEFFLQFYKSLLTNDACYIIRHNRNTKMRG